MPRKTPLPLISKIRITNLKNLRMPEGTITGNALRPDFREVKKIFTAKAFCSLNLA